MGDIKITKECCCPAGYLSWGGLTLSSDIFFHSYFFLPTACSFCLMKVMSDAAMILCKPTKWFLYRAVGMLAMFAFLGGWFYKDATKGYRLKNEIFVMDQNFAKASHDFQEFSKTSGFSSADWTEYASRQQVNFGDDLSLLPTDLVLPRAWPDELKNAELLSKGQSAAWDAYTERMKWDREAPDKFHDRRSINEQWYFCYALSALALVALFLLIRTSRRSMSCDQEKITTQEGNVVYFHELKKLDLRKWSTKGLAFGYFEKANGNKGKVRFDGMSYGGFQKEDGEPAEALMRRVRENFHGELIEYVSTETAERESEEETAKES